MDGYKLLILSKCELPNEVISINISDKNFVSVNKTEISFFENLNNLIADFNELKIEFFDSLKL